MADNGIYHAASNILSGSGSAQNLLSIENPSGSGLNVLISDVYLTAVQTALTATAFSYHFGRTTATPSAGTTLTSQKRDSSMGAASGIVRTAPTATAAAGQIWSFCPQLQLGLTLSGASPFFYVTVFKNRAVGEYLVLAPGEGVLLSADANLSTYNNTIIVSWREAAI